MRHSGISIGVAVALALLKESPAFARIMTEAFKRLGLAPTWSRGSSRCSGR